MKSTWVGAVAIGILVLAACEDDETSNPTTSASSTRAASTSASTAASTTASTGAGGMGGAPGGNGGTGGDTGGSAIGGNGTGGSMGGQLVINEVVSSSPDWVEFYNVGTGPIDISGWKFTDDEPMDPTKVYTFPANTIVPAGGYIVRIRDTDNNVLPEEFTFGLGDSDSVLLFDAATDPMSTNPPTVDSTTWVNGDADATWGRLPNGTGTFQVLTAPTQGAANM